MLAGVSSFDAHLLVLVGLTLMAVWGRHIILYTGAFAALAIYGFEFAQTELVTGLAVVLLAVYMLYKGVLWFGH